MTAAERQHQASRDTTAGHLRALREQWGDLLAAIDTRPAEVWPPMQPSVQHLAADTAEDEAADDRAAVGRLPLVLREYPAPVNADALDCALAIEREVFDLADRIASVVQRPNRNSDDWAHPARWHLPSHRDVGLWVAAGPGSRAYGLHWACVWVEGRVMDEPEGDLFAPLPLRLLDDARNVAGRCRARLERVLNRDTRTVALPAVCPWCGQGLMGRTTGGDPMAAVVWCTGGAGCGAPAELDAYGRRHWQGRTLPALWGALEQRQATTA